MFFELPICIAIRGMTYEPLNEAQNQIRVLQFERPWHPDLSSERLRLSLKNVSLDHLSDSYVFLGSNHDVQEAWRDDYTEEIETRCLAPSHSVPSPHTASPRADNSSSRFAWGDYEALSYAWGDRTQVAHIYLNGSLKEVSRDLEAALRALHCLPETQLGMYYWIDALCINQDDISERSQQVKHMYRIYREARAVVVWLGPETEDDDRAIRVMTTTRRDSSQNGWIIPPPHLNARDWNALCAFLRKPYWNRLWIIQELAVNHDHTLILCGTRKLTRDMVKMAARCCQKLLRENDPAIITHNQDAWEISTRVYRLVDVESALGQEAMSMRVLHLSREALASDDRDKVYGILGLLDPSVASQINPDYSSKTTIQDVFTGLTIAIIRATRNLDQIAYGPDTLTPTWPSWIQDLRLSFRRNHVRYLRESKASLHHPSDFYFVETNSLTQLRVKGVYVDAIDGIAASSSLQDDEPIYPTYSPARYKKSVPRILGRTLAMDHPKIHRYPAFINLPWNCENSQFSSLTNSSDYAKFQSFREKNRSFLINGRAFQSYFPEQPDNKTIPKSMAYHLHFAIVSMEGRKLCTTRTGYVCLMPETVQRGDLLVILLGCNFPVLLRPFGEMYRVVGECYVYGLMEGEIFEVRDGEGLKYRDFILV
jgi:hypothetical protein